MDLAVRDAEVESKNMSETRLENDQQTQEEAWVEMPTVQCHACGARLLCLRSSCLLIASCPGCGLKNRCPHH